MAKNKKRKKKITVFASMEGEKDECSLFRFLKENYHKKGNDTKVNITENTLYGGTPDTRIDECFKKGANYKYSFAWVDEDIDIGKDTREKLFKCWKLEDVDKGDFLKCKLKCLQERFNKRMRNPILIVSQPICVENLIFRMLGHKTRYKELNQAGKRDDQVRNSKNSLGGACKGSDLYDHLKKSLTREDLEIRRKEIPELDLLIRIITQEGWLSFTDKIRQACAEVARRAEFVHILPEGIEAYAKKIAPHFPYQPQWDAGWHYEGENEALASYILSLDAVNFGSGYFKFLKKRPDLSGYMTVASCLKDKFEANPLTAADLQVITPRQCADIFEQDMNKSDMAELMERFSGAWHELGHYIVEHYKGSFSDFIKSAEGSVEALAEKLSLMPKFHDVVDYDIIKVHIYKRAQIVAADIYLGFKGQGLGEFHDLNKLTIFADNAVPHVLRMEGVFEYEASLAKRIDAEELLIAGSKEEVELRACSIHAVELILKSLHDLGCSDVIAMNVDHYIWDNSHNDEYRLKPKHRTKTVFY